MRSMLKTSLGVLVSTAALTVGSAQAQELTGTLRIISDMSNPPRVL